MEVKRGITITTSAYTHAFLKGCLESVKDTPYDILIVSNDNYTPDLSYFDRQYELVINQQNEWELGGVKQGAKRFDEQIHLMDTSMIKDISLFPKLFEINGHVVLTKGNYHYQGKFVSKDLPELPLTLTKEEAIKIEMSWLPKPYTEFKPDLPVHTQIFTEIHGQTRMVLQNDYMIKYKGTWRN